MRRYSKFNPKRRLKPKDGISTEILDEQARSVIYTGNPEHKQNPGDFDLVPPARARRGKALCDRASIFKRKEAQGYLQEGLRRGAVSEQFVGGWPKNIWAVSDEGIPLEAQREADGHYHGYPMPSSDPMAAVILEFWKANE